MEEGNKTNISFDLPKNRSNVIKVIGVGGGGSNAINYMFLQGIKGVDFIVSNTDAQALYESPVPVKIQLGAALTEGLGAGANPEIGAQAARESYEEIESLLTTQTKMVFVTAGMGGGTGTGAAPVIAKMAKQLDILTVGIVTMPFQFEGKLRMEQAQKGLENMRQSVDALIAINNNKLREVYGNLGFKAGFSKADEVLTTAARGVAEVITHHYTQNIDLKDAKTVLTNSGTAIMGSGTATGSNRSQEAISKALDSPLLNDNKITGCKNVLLLIVSGAEEITIDEIGEINDFIQAEAGNDTNIIMGIGEDESLGNAILVTVIATGFEIDKQNDIVNTEVKKIIHTLEDDQKLEHHLTENDSGTNNLFSKCETPQSSVEEREVEEKTYYSLENSEVVNEETAISDSSTEVEDENVMNLDVVYEILSSNPCETIQCRDDKVGGSQNDLVINEISSELSEYEEDQGSTQFHFNFELPFSKKDGVEKDSGRESQSEKIGTKETLEIEPKSVSSELIEEESSSAKSENEIHLKTSEEKKSDDLVIGNNRRKEYLKVFNYKFKHQLHQIEEMENEPAYKRMGVDLDVSTPKEPDSQLSFDNDSNDDLQLRSNSYFLNDNAD